MIKLNKKQKRQLRRLGKLPQARKIQGHRHQLTSTMERYARTALQRHPGTHWRGPW